MLMHNYVLTFSDYCELCGGRGGKISNSHTNYLRYVMMEAGVKISKSQTSYLRYVMMEAGVKISNSLQLT